MSCPKYTLLVAVSIFLAAGVRAWAILDDPEIVDHKLDRNVDQVTNEKVEELDEILNCIFPQKEWEENGKLWKQKVSNQPATRMDVIKLTVMLDMTAKHLQARETGICPIRKVLYSQCFDEIIRQVTIDCAERGLLLLKIRDELQMTADAYQTLYNCIIPFGIRKPSTAAEHEQLNELNRLAELVAKKQKIKDDLTTAIATYEMIQRRETEQRMAVQRRHNDEITFYNRTNHQMQFLIERIQTPNRIDVSVVTPLQIHFLTRNADENLIENKLKEMGAIAYNPITKDIYVSDSNAKEGSIFRIKTTGDAAFSVVEPIVAKQNESVQALAFDYHTSKLYWTDGSGHTIRVVRVPENMTKVPLPGKVLHSFKDQIPQGLAIDVCRGYLYWTNSYHKNATIERSFLNGTGREVLINETLYQPFAIAVDVEHNLLYWSDEREGMFYNIDSLDLNAIGAGRRRLISGAHNRPFAMALDERYIYWSDWTNDAVWTLPKDSFGGGVQPIQLAKYADGPMALMTPSGNTTVVNSTYCAMHRAKDIAESTKDAQPDLIPYEALRNICKNKGVLHMNGTCTCVPGFAGEFCQESACHGYCRSGACTLTGSGEPTCQCPENTTGVRCEVPLCALPCENNGKCTLDPSGFSTCKCPDGYSGDVCQYSTLIMDLCKSHCADTTVPESQKFGVCRCEKSTDTEDYNSVRADMMNHSDVSPCKISKSMLIVISILTVLVASLGVLTMILARKVRFLGRRPRIKKRIVVNKSITPLTHSRQQSDQNQQCEITIENCCNMNICETPCFEPNYRPTPKIMIPSLSRSKKEDKTKLLSISDMSSEDEKPVVRP